MKTTWDELMRHAPEREYPLGTLQKDEAAQILEKTMQKAAKGKRRPARSIRAALLAAAIAAILCVGTFAAHTFGWFERLFGSSAALIEGKAASYDEAERFDVTYPTYTEEMCGEMKKLVEFADILTPNVTEACVLTYTPYKEKWKIEEIQEMAEKIHKMGPKKIAITGIVQGGFIANFCYEEGQQPKVLRTHKEGTQRSGTGDIFASIIAADAVNGVPFYKSVKKASDFIKKCIIRSQELDIPLTDGVCFEEVLGKLKTD